ncbi:MAG: amidophosphoribosyltransferase [Flavobacteriales bacterium]|jgi:amidophosphoribosyltransferase|nr:amidophosphoribosyltransferase [Flavobacteriales bacterium]MBT5131533.1 amidophosphoribosyltransferase [Flavobacteriales bacterium]MBT6132337.1 amidophosphoribosyltransferase [Flavobacteriales bacterium]MBT6382676.1 amidophosphoribosyltransferase [Flavobacteriales bacterium]MBT6917666.1 amidophosphoribosyltransferase [Flavobacteriales bacterium]
MSDNIKHECGIALIRLLKPLTYYREKYGTSFYALNKMYLLMEKQHNRGQDGAGLANVKLDVKPGYRYISRYRSNEQQPLQDIFDRVYSRIEERADSDPEKLADPMWLKDHAPFTGELFLGHLRYGTYGENSIEACHPFLRQNNWMSRNLVLAGNFNMTNVDEQFDILLSLGQHPKKKADTVTVLEKIGHFLDEENEELFRKYKKLGYHSTEITDKISRQLNVKRILKRSATDFDGGYAMAGMIGNGDAFVLRDPNGIRPAFYYQDDEVVVVASERPVIQTAFNVKVETVKEIDPGHALIIKKDGTVSMDKIRKPGEKRSCSFERIYFSRGSDQDIYRERLALGRKVVPKVLGAINDDLDHSVFSFIPNTAEVSYYGMTKGLEDFHIERQIDELDKLGKDDKEAKLKILRERVRMEKVAIKDAKLRTFITQDSDRNDLVEHVYDITYGTVVPGKDNLVVIDDSIVRGTTLKRSILRILDRLGPKKIVVVSSAPQIRFPDCYGIDMSLFQDFIAFQAAIALLKETGREHVIKDVYQLCIDELEASSSHNAVNHVKKIYEPFTDEEVSAKIAELLRPEGLKADLEIIYQSVDGLHESIPNHTGDWYFTGNYPTTGGNRVVNRSFVNYFEGKRVRAY